MRYFTPVTLDVKYLVDYKDIQEGRDCFAAGCDDICRCSTIYNVEYEPVNTFQILDYFLKYEHTNDPFELYIIERVLKRSNLEVDYTVTDGYYGEEIGTETIETPLFCFDPNNIFDRIKSLLIEEYGYFLEEQEDCELYYDKVPLKEIVHSRNHPVLDKDYKNDTPSPINYGGDLYKADLPLCICVPDGDKYRIIDGNHRIGHLKSSNKVGDNKLVPIIYYG